MTAYLIDWFGMHQCIALFMFITSSRHWSKSYFVPNTVAFIHLIFYMTHMAIFANATPPSWEKHLTPAWSRTGVSNHSPGGSTSCRVQLQHTGLEVSSNPEELVQLVQVSLIRIGAELCRIVALRKQDWTPLILEGTVLYIDVDEKNPRNICGQT